MILGGNFGLMMLTIKSEDWAKEKEYRLACPLSAEVTEVKESPLVMRDGFLEIGDLLHAVIMGCEMPSEGRRAYKGAVKRPWAARPIEARRSCSTQILSDTGECGLV